MMKEDKIDINLIILINLNYNLKLENKYFRLKNIHNKFL